VQYDQLLEAWERLLGRSFTDPERTRADAGVMGRMLGRLRLKAGVLVWPAVMIAESGGLTAGLHRRQGQPGYVAGKVSKGASWSADVSEPCMPISADSRGSAFVATTAEGPAGAATTSPTRVLAHLPSGLITQPVSSSSESLAGPSGSGRLPPRSGSWRWDGGMVIARSPFLPSRGPSPSRRMTVGARPRHA
jgi:hypothetical protein